MPRVRIGQPSPQAIAAHPREYAIYLQCKPDQEGVVSEKEYTEIVGKYGGEGIKGKGEIAFDEFASAVAAAPTPGFESFQGNCVAYATHDSNGVLSPFKVTRRELGPDDVRVQVVACGMCHSDYHSIKNEWQGSTYPMVPGHEIAGYVTEVGPNVSEFKVGDAVGVGCMVDSCQQCEFCEAKDEPFCPGCIFTYNSKDKDGTVTNGGYSNFVVVNKKFVLRIPPNLPLTKAAPLLCAGITTYAPLRDHGIDKPGMALGVVGLGGLGHMAVKLGKGMGLKVTVLSTSDAKKEEAMRVLGADAFVNSKDSEALKAIAGTLDGIIDTVSANHPLEPYLKLLRPRGKLVLLGLPPDPLALKGSNIIQGNKCIAGSMIGGIAQTQEMLDFCGEHGITCETEVIPVSYVNEAMERLVAGKVHYRFVIDVQGSLVG